MWYGAAVSPLPQGAGRMQRPCGLYLICQASSSTTFIQPAGQGRALVCLCCGRIGMLVALDVLLAEGVLHAGPGEDEGREGLAAYDVDTVPDSLMAEAATAAEQAQQAPQLLLRHIDRAVLEQVDELQKLISGRHLPTVQAWLRTLVKVRAACPHGWRPVGRPAHQDQLQEIA